MDECAVLKVLAGLASSISQHQKRSPDSFKFIFIIMPNGLGET